MIQEIERFLLQDCRFDKGVPILVGVSGGPDSLCLLDAMVRLGFSVVVAHLNHGFRPEAAEEARQLEARVIGLGLPFIGGVEDVPGFAAAHHYSKEEAARILRYRFLYAQANKISAQAVAVGHTLDDQAETILLHLVRGSGLDGLTGMRPITISVWDTSIPLVRPLLPFTRVQILNYCQERRLSPVYDRSNQDPIFLRNRVRNELLPVLADYNPRIRESLGRLAEILTGDQVFLENTVEESWEQLARLANPGIVCLPSDGFLALDVAIQRRLIRKAVTLLRPGMRDLDFETIERVRMAVQDRDYLTRLDMTGGIRLVVGNDWFTLGDGSSANPSEIPSRPQLEGANPAEIDRPGCYSLGDRWRLRISSVPVAHLPPEGSPLLSDPNQAWLDGERLTFPLRIRTRQAGDRFQPFGMHGHSIKLSDYMINEKIPVGFRERWPLVCRENEIAWVVGYRPAEPYRLTQSSPFALHFHLFQE